MTSGEFGDIIKNLAGVVGGRVSISAHPGRRVKLFFAPFRGGRTLPPRTARSDPRWLDDPQVMFRPLPREHGQRPGEQGQHTIATWFGWTHHDNAGVVGRWIRPNVSEVEIKREEYPSVGAAHRAEPLVVGTSQPSS
jgi:hypothetical protein